MTGKVNFQFDCEKCGTACKASVDFSQFIQLLDVLGDFSLFCIKCGKKQKVYTKRTGWEEK